MTTKIEQLRKLLADCNGGTLIHIEASWVQEILEVLEAAKQYKQEQMDIMACSSERTLSPAEIDLWEALAKKRIVKLEKVREEAWCTQDGNIPNSALNEALKACEEPLTNEVQSKEPTT